MSVRFLFALFFLAAACATGPRGDKLENPPRASPRPPGCGLTILHNSSPGVADWDNLGVAEISCHIDVGVGPCLAKFRAEACRMGGDIVYDLPQEPQRPREQAIMFRGRVARSRPLRPRVLAPSTTTTNTTTTTTAPAKSF